MFERVISLIGEDNLEKLKLCHILVVGLGGVGAVATESLARSGVGTFTLIDYDIIEESNLNRQIMTNTTNIGLKKTDILAQRLKDINPYININLINEFLNEDNLDKLKTYDYIIDACDTVKTKVLLINYATKNNIPIISCMGTGKRLDPTKLKITTLDKTYNDPLAKVMRKEINNINIPLKKVKVVFSIELPINHEKTIGSMMFVPSSAGLLISSSIIQDIINNPKNKF